MQIDTEKIDSLINKYRARKESLIPLLLDIQSHLNWLPEEVLREVAQRLQVPLIDVYGVATFYKAFSLKPRGKHLITVCLGTACHVRGGQRIAEAISRELGIQPGETTKDLKFSLETVNCLGCCAIGPIVVIDGEYYGGMTPQKALSLIKRIEKER